MQKQIKKTETLKMKNISYINKIIYNIYTYRYMNLIHIH